MEIFVNDMICRQEQNKLFGLIGYYHDVFLLNGTLLGVTLLLS